MEQHSHYRNSNKKVPMMHTSSASELVSSKVAYIVKYMNRAAVGRENRE